jgi:hypothetical protein
VQISFCESAAFSRPSASIASHSVQCSADLHPLPQEDKLRFEVSGERGHRRLAWPQFKIKWSTAAFDMKSSSLLVEGSGRVWIVHTSPNPKRGLVDGGQRVLTASQQGSIDHKEHCSADPVKLCDGCA